MQRGSMLTVGDADLPHAALDDDALPDREDIVPGSSTSQTPNAGTTSPVRGPVPERAVLLVGEYVNGSIASQRVRQSMLPWVSRGISADTTSKSSAVAGGRLILTSRLRMDPTPYCAWASAAFRFAASC
jgi:hypothetical protein